MNSLVFNHHSLPFSIYSHVESSMVDFLKICLAAKNIGLSTIFVDEHIDKSWFRVELYPGYFWNDWYNSHKSGEYKDIIRAFRSVIVQSPFLTKEDIIDGADLLEVFFEENPKYASLHAAAWHRCPIIGFDTCSPWNSTPLLVNVLRLNPDNGEIENCDIEILNLYNYTVFSSVLPKIQEEREVSLVSGKEIFSKFKDHYPEICLCGKSEQQLNNWSASLSILKQVKKCFSILNQFSQKWINNEYKDYDKTFLHQAGLTYQISGESETVKNNPRLRREREFWLPCGEKFFFDQHIKLSSGYRLHFYPDKITRRIYIGYIGPHLRLK